MLQGSQHSCYPLCFHGCHPASHYLSSTPLNSTSSQRSTETRWCWSRFMAANITPRPTLSSLSHRPVGPDSRSHLHSLMQHDHTSKAKRAYAAYPLTLTRSLLTPHPPRSLLSGGVRHHLSPPHLHKSWSTSWPATSLLARGNTHTKWNRNIEDWYSL